MMARKKIIAVIGHDLHAKEEHRIAAEKVGREIAKKGAIVLCGGRGAVPLAAARGAEKEGGISVGILPDSEKKDVPACITIPVMTGIGFARNQVIAHTADAVIAVGGAIGTFTEAAYSYFDGKPVIVLEAVEGILNDKVGKYLDNKKIVKLIGAKTPEEAVGIALEKSAHKL